MPPRFLVIVHTGKAEHASFELPTVSLHVHERIDPKTIMEAVRRRNGTRAPVQGSLFESPEENPPRREAIDFYQHVYARSRFEPFVKTSWPCIILVALNVPSSSR